LRKNLNSRFRNRQLKRNASIATTTISIGGMVQLKAKIRQAKEICSKELFCKNGEEIKKNGLHSSRENVKEI
jgi:hypothetical protein